MSVFICDIFVYIWYCNSEDVARAHIACIRGQICMWPDRQVRQSERQTVCQTEEKKQKNTAVKSHVSTVRHKQIIAISRPHSTHVLKTSSRPHNTQVSGFDLSSTGYVYMYLFIYFYSDGPCCLTLAQSQVSLNSKTLRLAGYS